MPDKHHHISLVIYNQIYNHHGVRFTSFTDNKITNFQIILFYRNIAMIKLLSV